MKSNNFFSIDKKSMMDLQANLKELSKGLNAKEQRKALVKGGRVFSKSAKNKAPVGERKHSFKTKSGDVMTFAPGNLKRSIKVLPKNRKSGNNVMVGPKMAKKGKASGHYSGRRVNAFYAHWVEYGTTKQAAQPYMRPAFDEAQGRATLEAIKEVNKILDTKIRHVPIR